MPLLPAIGKAPGIEKRYSRPNNVLRLGEGTKNFMEPLKNLLVRLKVAKRRADDAATALEEFIATRRAEQGLKAT